MAYVRRDIVWNENATDPYAYSRILRGIQKKRSRIKQLAKCQTIEEIYALDWVKNTRSLGKKLPDAQMSTQRPEVFWRYDHVERDSLADDYDIANPLEMAKRLGERVYTYNLHNDVAFPINEDSSHQPWNANNQNVTFKVPEDTALPSFDRIAAVACKFMVGDVPIERRGNTGLTVIIKEDIDKNLYNINAIPNNNVSFYFKYVKDNVITDVGSNSIPLQSARFARTSLWIYEDSTFVYTFGGMYPGITGIENLRLADNMNYNDPPYNVDWELAPNFWVFATEAELDHYLLTGDYTSALNYAEPKPTTEFDFYYRTRYGAEFPWPEEPEPGPEPGTPLIAGTMAHAGEYGSGSHNLEAQENSTFADVVTYNGLTPGLPYTLVGKVYDKTDSKFLDEAETEIEFIPEDVYGDAIINFELDTTSMQGHTLVLYSYLYGVDEEGLPDHFIDQHEDPDDEDEFIYVLEPAPPVPWDIDDDGGYPVVVDDNFNVKGIVDIYESMIWTDRFDRAGDFEIYSKVDKNMLDALTCDTYFYIKESDHTMIVEKIVLSSDPDEGDKLCITGRSLESILDRRVIWRPTTINGNLQEGIHRLLNENVIRPQNDERRIANFIFEQNNDSRITSLKMDAEYFGDNLYDVICDLCKSNHIGFRIILNTNNQYVFKLLPGVDRSYDNADNNLYIIFGAEYDNVVNSNYVENKESFKNVIRIAGADNNNTSYNNTKYTGLSRRETYISATDIDTENMTEDSYKAALQERGKTELTNYANTKSADGTMITQKMEYLKDFGLGDIIEYKDVYGLNAKMRISEVIIKRDKNGFTIYPSFEDVEEKQ